MFSKHEQSLVCRQFYQVVAALNTQGVPVDCVCARELKPPRELPEFNQHQVKVPRRFKQGLLYWCCFFFSGSVELIRLIRSLRPKRFFCTDALYSCLAFPACVIFRVPIVLVLFVEPWELRRRSRTPFFRRKFLALADRIGLRAASEILVSTKTLRDELSKRSGALASKIDVYTPSIAVAPELPRNDAGELDIDAWRDWLTGQSDRKHELAEHYQLPEKWLFILASAELAGKRSLDTLVRALSASENERLAVFICGVAAEKNYFQAMAISLGLYDQLTLFDSLEEFSDLAAGCDLFIQPSTQSGSSDLICDALGHGLPVIAADCPEAREVLGDDSHFFTARNVQSLVERLHGVSSTRGELTALRRLSNERAIELGEELGQTLAKRVE